MGPADLPARTGRKSRRRRWRGSPPPSSSSRACWRAASSATAAGRGGGGGRGGRRQQRPHRGGGDFGTTADAGAVLDRIADLAPDAAFAVGDLSHNNAPESDWCAFVTSRLGAGLPFELLSGNHESDGLNGSIGAFTSCLPNKLAGLVGSYGRGVLRGPPGRQASHAGHQHLCGPALPRWDLELCQRGRALQLGRHRDRLRPSRGHQLGHGQQPLPVLGVAAYACVMPADFYGLLQDRRVDLVVDGHDHTYMRTHQLAGSNVGCPRIPRVGFDADCVADSDNSYVAGRGRCSPQSALAAEPCVRSTWRIPICRTSPPGPGRT